LPTNWLQWAEKRIEQARRELRLAEGTAGEEELRASALDQQMEVFRDQVNALLDLSASYLLGIQFTRAEERLVARLTADGISFELRQGDSHNFILMESDSKRVLLSIMAAEQQSANRIVCAIADSLAAAEQPA
jgi:hypothetical protein